MSNEMGQNQVTWVNKLSSWTTNKSAMWHILAVVGKSSGKAIFSFRNTIQAYAASNFLSLVKWA